MKWKLQTSVSQLCIILLILLTESSQVLASFCATGPFACNERQGLVVQRSTRSTRYKIQAVSPDNIPSEVHVDTVQIQKAEALELTHWTEVATAKCQEWIQAVDIKQTTTFFLLVTIFLLGVRQRQQGIEFGKATSQLKIDHLKDELQTAKDSAKSEDELNAGKLNELHSQMDELQVRVGTLAVAAQEVTRQLPQEKADPNTNSKAKNLPRRKAKAEQLSSSSKKRSEKRGVSPPRAAKGSKASFAESDKENTKKKETKPAKATGAAKATRGVEADGKPETKETRKVVAKNQTKTTKVTSNKTKEATKLDWARLAPSTLKRKTVKELTGYLEKKGIQVKDENGKTFKKDTLVHLILNASK
ncbi:expressed unknown protein [Seminavis robusta]|uniref:Uncharacterized protein n=1 Tax=Seminavis robusta TaxID=568900 RepID=A0A9N8DJ94_9STRA|nr:expressed unknown protein [Seminavis robusta]|eukprot:Sro117_g057420.1 n/a (360) ;mRNA; r:64564-65756